jgi:aryl carrier-like protein
MRRAGSIGLPFTNEFAIVGADDTWVAAGEVGEILVRGPEVFRGYEGDAASARDDFFQGWFRTGDLGHVDRDGYLYIVGREKELVNRGGFKVSPSAVDAALMRHPEVVDAGTFAVPHATLGEDVATAVVLRASASVSAQALRDFAFLHLPAFMVPSQVVTVSALGRTPAGKLDRTALALAVGLRLHAGFTPPRDPTEALVAGVFADVLGVAAIGAFDNFFELGGDSLRGARVVVRVNALRGTDVDVVSLFQRPTVAEFAAVLARAGAAAAEPAIRSREDRGSGGAAAETPPTR